MNERSDDRARPGVGPGPDPARLVAGGGAGALCAAVHGPHPEGATRAPRLPRTERRADEHFAVDQDRRLPGRLRLLPAERPLRHRCGCRSADAGGRSSRVRRAGQGGGSHALLHGRRLPRTQGARPRGDLRDDPRGACPRARNLRHPRNAESAAGRAAEGRRPRLLQPQPRHLAGVLRRDHPHPHLSAAARHARGRARGGTQGLLRRHHRHG